MTFHQPAILLLLYHIYFLFFILNVAVILFCSVSLVLIIIGFCLVLKGFTLNVNMSDCFFIYCCLCVHKTLEGVIDLHQLHGFDRDFMISSK